MTADTRVEEGYFTRLVVWSDRSPRSILALGRTILVISILAQYGTNARNGEESAIMQMIGGGLLVWMMIGAASIALSIKAELMVRPVVLVIDFIVLTLLMAFVPAVELPVMFCFPLLLRAVFERMGGRFVALFGLAAAAVLIVRHFYPPIISIFVENRGSATLDYATVALAGLTMATLIGSAFRSQSIRRWTQQVQAAGGNLLDLQAPFLVKEVAKAYGAHRSAMLLQDLKTGSVQCLALEEGSVSPIVVPDTHVQALLRAGVTDRTFLFALATDNILYRNRLGGLSLQRASEIAGPLADLFAMRRGLSFPIHAGNLRGRMFVECNHGWSAILLDEVERIADAVESFFERYLFLGAWRNRAFLEARSSIARDLHDGVLQSLASMRMRCATLGEDLKQSGTDAQRAEVWALEQVVIAEQTQLRELLSQSSSEADAVANLSQELKRCADLVERQWDISCRVVLDTPDFPVGRTTAIEVEFLMREVVANAVQHAGARHVVVSVARQDEELLIAFRDAGSGPPVKSGETNGEFMVQSRSVLQRLTSIGGTAYFDDLGRSSLLSLRIPLPHSFPLHDVKHRA